MRVDMMFKDEEHVGDCIRQRLFYECIFFHNAHNLSFITKYAVIAFLG